TTGDNATAFTWRIKYVDANDNDPLAANPAFMKVYIDGTGYNMQKEDPS
ncbi:MAG: hypothetical protein GW802_34940, partial [Armatimonadetes bacterium]|nr:hypothetical protein [Armatimonadota bacterium]